MNNAYLEYDNNKIDIHQSSKGRRLFFFPSFVLVAKCRKVNLICI